MSRASNQKINAELFSLEPTALLEFFVIHYDYVERPDDKLYIHGGTNGINGSIYWQGIEYLPFPIQSSGFESKGDGSLPRPKLAVSNQDFFVSNLIRRYSNLVGAKVVRKRTFLKFLDNVNFSNNLNPYGSADPTAGLEDQVFFILRRASENRSSVEFELASPLEIENVTLPRRIVMARYCQFHYRGNGCRYTGRPVADENDRKILGEDLKFESGLIKRTYSQPNTADRNPPANSAEFTSKMVTANFLSEENVSDISISPLDYIYHEFLGYFKVGKTEGGEYSFGVDPDDAAEIFVDSILVAGDYGGGTQNPTPPNEGFGPQGTTGSIVLTEGYHRILIRFYEQAGTQNLRIYYKTPPSSGDWTVVPAIRWYRNASEMGALNSSQKFFTTVSLTHSVGLEIEEYVKMQDRKLWGTGQSYSAGDYVYLENFNVKVSKLNINEKPNSTPLLKFFVCIKSHTANSSRNPLFNREFWVADQCSKSLDGCRLRFNDGHLPFGGFPGTEEYSISNQ
jgi:lambda family phage minor tail protein L